MIELEKETTKINAELIAINNASLALDLITFHIIDLLLLR